MCREIENYIMPLNKNIKKVLVIGSGAIVIGQAAEFDYAGVQACRALKSENIKVILVNSNPATIMTDENIADKVYIEPLTVESLSYIIEKERPNGIIATVGGQTGLNLLVSLDKAGILRKFNVKILGTNIDSVKLAEDRELFKNLMIKIAEPVLESEVVSCVEQAKCFAKKIGFPIIIRPAFTLGGSGGGIAHNSEEFEEIVYTGLNLSPISQVLLEKCVIGYKEIEYEVIRDSADKSIVICNMENIDPMGIHTGDSFVVAPCQTLTQNELKILKKSALKIAKALKIEGGCNIQFALNSKDGKYYVIEVNPRASRSSALASKATGYPIAKIITKIAIGYNSDEIKNPINDEITAAIEPAIDYVVTKIPNWCFDKFKGSDRTLGATMKATGEVMAIGKTFESSFKKAIASLELKNQKIFNEQLKNFDEKNFLEILKICDDKRMFRIIAALKKGVSPEIINEITKIDKWFILKFKELIECENKLTNEEMSYNLYLTAKEKGFSDEEIAGFSKKTLEEINKFKKENSVNVTFKAVDTYSGKYDFKIPYFYSVYNETDKNNANTDLKKILILGSGAIRIGQGIEFDYCSVHAVLAVKANNYKSLIINSNPETLSTDFDIADKLYFEPVQIENIMNIIEKEKPDGVMVQFGGQTAINLTQKLHERGVKILGTTLTSMNCTEDRKLFEELLQKLKIPQPKGNAVLTKEEALNTAEETGYPLLVRPSYVIGGDSMQIIYNKNDFTHYIEEALKISNNYPILIDKYIDGIEFELDVISDGQEILIPAILEHIEPAGIHSGDSIAIYPTKNIPENIILKAVEYTKKIVKELNIIGLMNIQFVLKDNIAYIIEVNPRASRTVPIVSKITNIPMVEIAVAAILGKKIKEQGYPVGLLRNKNISAVKIPIFPFQKLNGIDPKLTPEMKSTGEVLGVDTCYEHALIKGFLAAGYNLSDVKKNVFVSINENCSDKSLKIGEMLTNLGFNILAPADTHKFFSINNIKSVEINNLDVKKFQQEMKDKNLSFIINIPLKTNRNEKTEMANKEFQIRTLASTYSIPCFTVLETAQAYLDALKYYGENNKLNYNSIDEYRN